ncbi:sugar ABC transporter ATP-binding protein [Labrys neptuniae]
MIHMKRHSDAQPSGAPAVAIEVRGIAKAFGATVALDDVSFDIRAGETHALLGENGAGKSTMVKLLSGLMQPSTGGFGVFGEQVILASPREAHRHGIQTAFQELTQIRDLSVLDNMLLPYPPTALGQIRRGAARKAVSAHLESLSLGDIGLDTEMRDLDLNQRQKLEIARALFREPKILLLDEPTSALSGSDIDWLGGIIEAQRRKGVTMVFISHRMAEVRAFCDCVTVLRNGRHIATERLDAVADEDLISMIAGRELGRSFPPKPPVPAIAGEPVLSVSHLRTSRRLMDLSFELRAGEILGVAGLQGMGQLELFSALFGMEDYDGTISVDGRPVTLISPRDALEARIGLALVPEDRKTEALFLKLDGQRNAALPVIERYGRLGLIDETREEADVARVFARLNVDMRALWTPVKAFSGGNQQKIAIAKWLLAKSRVLLLFDPTRGIDVGTKHEIYALIQEYAAAGGAVLFHSTEIAELDHLAHRVMVLYRGREAAMLRGESLSEDAILRATLGSGPNVLELS